MLIRDCRNKCGQIPAVAAELVDFWNFTRVVQNSMPAGWQIKTLTSLSALLQKAIFRKYIHAVYDIETDSLRPVHPSCFSVCFPTVLRDGAAADVFYTTYMRKDAHDATAFAHHYGWSDFLAAYLAQLKALQL